MSIAKEFPDFDDAEGFRSLLAELGGEDGSWHNDACPCIGLADLDLSIWYDWKDRTKRESSSLHQFAVTKTLDRAEVLATNNRKWLVTFINCLREHHIAADLCEEHGFTATAAYLRGLLEHT